MLFLLLQDKEPATAKQSAEEQFRKQVEDTLRPYASGQPAIKGEMRLLVPSGMSGGKAKSIIEDSLQVVPALRDCTVQAGGKYVIIAPPPTQAHPDSSLSLSTIPTAVSESGVLSVDWTGLIRKYQTPNVCYEYYLAANNSDNMPRERRREYAPAAPGQSVELLQNNAKVGEAKVGAGQCLLTFSYREGERWVPFQRQLAQADLATAVNVVKAVQDGLNLAIEQVSGGSKSKKSGAPALTDYHLELLAYQLYFNFKTYKVVKSDESTSQTDDLVSTQTASWGQVLGGIGASNLASADKEFVKSKLREYYGSGSVVQTQGTAGPMSLTGSISFAVESIVDYILPISTLEGLPGYLPSPSYTSPNDADTLTQYLQYRRYALSRQFSDLLSPFSECLGGDLQYEAAALNTRSDRSRFSTRPKWMEAGLTSSGQPYVVLDPETYRQVRNQNGNFIFPYGSLIVSTRPEDGFPLFRGERKDGQWNLAFNLQGKSDSAFVDNVLEPAFAKNRQDLLNLADEASSPKSATRAALILKCGRVSDQQLLADPEFSPVLHIRAVRKLDANGGFLVGAEWSEWQSAYSILGYCRGPNLLTFGIFSVDSPMMSAQGGGAGRVVRVIDERTGIMGEAPLPEGDLASPEAIRAAAREAVRSLSHNIFAARGFYDYYEKLSGQPVTSSTPHYSFAAVYETPAYRALLRDMGGALSFGLMSGNPIVAGIGFVGWTASNIEKSVGREERRLHTGEGYGGMDYADMTMQMFILTLRLPLWWARAVPEGGGLGGGLLASEETVGGALAAERLLAAGRLFSQGSTSAKWWFGGSITAAIASDTYAGHIEGEGEYAKEHLDGRPLASTIRPSEAANGLLARLPKDADPATFDIFSFVFESYLTSLFNEGYGVTASVAQAKNEWGPALNRALLSPEPYGEPMPTGLSAQDAGAWQSIMLVRNAMWIEQHKAFVKELSKKLDWSLGDTCLALLMYGGPRIENTEIETLATILKTPAGAFDSAAASLSTFSPPSKTRFPRDVLEDDLKRQFMLHRVRLSEIKP